MAHSRDFWLAFAVWALGLAQSMNRMGACVQLVVGELLRRALEIQKEKQP